MAQTLEQRRRNAKFVKEQDARRGKAETDVKKRNKDVVKSPISPIWLDPPPGWSLYNLGEIVTEGSKSGIQLATSVGASRYIFGGIKEPPFFAGELQQSEESAEDRSRVHCAG
ncbi:hypothetical protein F4823DRAFT_437527 [Ustulina deusta]|nr:hypothetical protein F4823DRAFT_437527 [Ustulina deusta]